MLLRIELIGMTGDVVSSHDWPNMAGWPDRETASAELRRKAAWLDPEPLICGGYETREPHPSTGLRERVSFWPELASV